MWELYAQWAFPVSIGVILLILCLTSKRLPSD